ncbi:MAG: glycosyltransferase [Myxococcota bacterium]|nr:glycosyltransferase [Myxococcota bacterium]
MSDPTRAPVLHLITRMIVGGAQENTLLSAAELAQRGWQTAILSGPETGPEGSLHEAVRQRRVPFEIEPALRRELSPHRDALALARLVRRLRRDGTRIVHTHSSKAGILGRWAAWLAGVPVVVHTVHGWSFHGHQRRAARSLYVALERASAARSQALVVVSDADRRKGLDARIGAPEQYVRIRSAIDVARFRPRPEARRAARAAWAVPGDAPVVGTVTRLSPQKAPLDFVEAAAAVARERPDARFVVIGDGPLRDAVESRVRALGLAERFALPGLCADVAAQLPGLDVFALTSLWEGLPRVLPQALAARVPVVATRVDGNVEALCDGAAGRLVPPARPDAVARAVLSVLEDPAAAAAHVAAGSRWAEREFGLDTMLTGLESLYLRLLARAGPPGR